MTYIKRILPLLHKENQTPRRDKLEAERDLVKSKKKAVDNLASSLNTLIHPLRKGDVDVDVTDRLMRGIAQNKQFSETIKLLKERRNTGLGFSYKFWEILGKIINCFRKLQSPLTTGIKTAAIGNKLHVFFDQSKKFEETSSNEKNLQESSNDNDRIGSDARKGIIAKK